MHRDMEKECPYMKWKTLILLFLFSVLLIGCSEKTYEPREINAETDICKVCNMGITHEDYAAQLVFKNGDYEVFDDLGCLIEFMKDVDESEVGAAFIKSADGNEWLPVEEATYVYSKDYWTPMNYGVLAFSSKDAAEQYMKENGEGERLTYEQLYDFKWGIHH